MTDTETENGLREAMRTATSHAPAPVAFAEVGRRVRLRRRRQALAAAGTLVAVAVAAPLWVAQVGDGGRRAEPARPGHTATAPLPTAPPEDTSKLPPAAVQEPWTAERWRRLPWRATDVPRRLDPAAAGTTSLAADPVGRALAAVQAGERGPIHLLGEDGRWRVQDLVDAEPTVDPDGYRDRPLGIGSLTSDGTRLALPQPDGLIVIDLTANTVHRHELPGMPQRVTWAADDREVLVSSDRDDSGRVLHALVDAETGVWRQVPYGAHLTSYAADGTAFTARHTSEFAYELRRVAPDGGAESPALPLPVDLFEDTDAVISANPGADALVAMRDVNHWDVPRPAGSWPGPTVVDADSGRALAHIPVRHPDVTLFETAPFGWADRGTVLLRIGAHVVAWDHESGALHRVAEVAGSPDGAAPEVTIAAGLV